MPTTTTSSQKQLGCRENVGNRCQHRLACDEDLMDHARESKHGEAAILELLKLQFLIGAELERVKANVAGLAGGVLEPAHTGDCQASLSYANAFQRISHVHHGVFPLVEVDLRPRNGGDDLEQDTGVDGRAGSDRVRVVARNPGNREELLRDHAHRGPDQIKRTSA